MLRRDRRIRNDNRRFGYIFDIYHYCRRILRCNRMHWCGLAFGQPEIKKAEQPCYERRIVFIEFFRRECTLYYKEKVFEKKRLDVQIVGLDFCALYVDDYNK